MSGAPWFMYPLVQGYTVGHGGNHDGWDLGAPSHTPLISLTGGQVTKHTGWYPWGGEVDIKGGALGSGVTETFAHADRIDVRPGDTVWPGQQVGLSGGEGLPLKYSKGPHVHYSLFGGAPWDNTKSIDPSSYLSSIRKNGGIGGLFDPSAVPGVEGLTKMFDNAFTNMETAVGKMVKRAGWFILGLILILLGAGLLMVPVIQQTRKEADKAIGVVAKAL